MAARRNLIIGSMLAGLAAPALASGVYLGAGVVRSDTHLKGTLVGNWDSRDSGLGLLGGYRISRWFALEAGYVRLGTASGLLCVQEQPCGPGAVPLMEVAAERFELAALARWPLGRLELFAKAGLARVHSDVQLSDVSTDITTRENRNESTVLLGLGAGLRIASRWQLRLQADGHEGDLTHVSAIWAGATYSFGQSD